MPRKAKSKEPGITVIEHEGLVGETFSNDSSPVFISMEAEKLGVIVPARGEWKTEDAHSFPSIRSPWEESFKELTLRIELLEKLVVLLARDGGAFIPELKNPLMGRSLDRKILELLASLPRVSEAIKDASL